MPLIALHNAPGEIMHAATQGARFAAVLPRAAAARDFLYAVARALNGANGDRRKGKVSSAARRRAVG